MDCQRWCVVVRLIESHRRAIRTSMSPSWLSSAIVINSHCRFRNEVLKGHINSVPRFRNQLSLRNSAHCSRSLEAVFRFRNDVTCEHVSFRFKAPEEQRKRDADSLLHPNRDGRLFGDCGEIACESTTRIPRPDLMCFILCFLLCFCKVTYLAVR
jgi:hypothetical protein